MKLPLLKEKNWKFTALAFAIPCVGMLLLMIICGYAPFGNKSAMLYSDEYHQYYPFFLAYRKALRSGESLLYSWNVGMGMDYLGLISYYLASPLYLLSILLPESWVLGYFELLSPIRMGLAGLFFAIFLKKVFKKNDLSISLFGAFYGLCAWALAFQWNVMWLDTFALLPLVALGTYSLLKDKKFILYTVTLFLSVYSNYYIGFFTCIFVLLSFICYQICRWQGFKKFFLDLLRIALFSILAIGMTAILELPTLAALQTTQSSVNKFPSTFRLNITKEHTFMGLLDAMRQVAGNMNGGLVPSFKEGLPNLYCGIGTIIFAFLFLTCKQVKVRDKICTVFLLLLFMVSFIIRQLDYIWHGFHFTNMIPYRFSFLFSFVMLYMAYRAFLLRHTFRPWQVITAGVLAIGILICSNNLHEFIEALADGSFAASIQPIFDNWTGSEADFTSLSEKLEILAAPMYTAIFLLLYIGILLYTHLRKCYPKNAEREVKLAWLEKRRFKLRVGAWLLFGVMGVELIANITGFAIAYPPTSISNYPKGTTDTKSAVAVMEELEDDNLFYRAEMTHSQTLNDGALLGYNGISTFTSSANVKTTEFMKALGYGAKNTYNRYCYEESSPVANLFLGIKYMIERDGEPAENTYFDDVYSSGNVHLLKNNAYLPLGFLANTQLTEVDFTDNSDRFGFQNRLISAASGIYTDVWLELVGSCLSITGEGVTLKSTSESGYCSYSVGSSKGTLVYTYDIYEYGFFCFDLNQSKKNKITVWKNGTELYSETYSLPQMLAVADVVPGDVIEIKLTCSANESGTVNLTGAILDEERFRRAYDVLAASTLELTTFKNTLVEGTIDCNRDGLLYTSIPQNGNWSVTVDGEPAEIKLVGDCMVAVEMTEGEHTVRFVYKNKAFTLGLLISLGCLAIFVTLWIVIYKPDFHRKPTKGKYQK